MTESGHQAVGRHVRVGDVSVPTFLYGTAWKEDDTERLTRMALDAGFVGIDTANQRRHYFEAGVGAAVGSAAIGRDALFLQTKFTHLAGQDHRLPYDPDAPIAEQVEQSFASSLEHLGVDALDSYVLHGPSARYGLAPSDTDAWSSMERLQQQGKTKLLGVSNVTLGQLEELCSVATVPPAMVQNRCFAATGWDRDVRAFCSERGMAYQGFSLLTANRGVLRHPRLVEIAARLGRSVPEVVFRFALQVGMIPLTGTTSAAHMQQDLSVYDFELDPEEVRDIETIAG